jgi:DNA-binding protein H-NS
MAVSLSELLAQKAALDKQIHDAQSSAKSDAIAQVRKIMAEHGLTALDLVAKSSSKPGAPSGKKVAAKYHDPVSGSTWTGRGLKPRWLTAHLDAGKNLQDFAV